MSVVVNELSVSIVVLNI